MRCLNLEFFGILSSFSSRLVHWYIITAASLIVWTSIVDTGVNKTQSSGTIGYSIAVGAVSNFIGLCFILMYQVPVLHSWAFGSSTATMKELCSLLFLTAWWIIALGLMTKGGGIAYDALNIYYSVWLSAIAVIIALNNWFYTRGTLSAKDFVNLSPTLATWYFMVFISMVMMGSSANFYVHFNISEVGGSPKSDYIFAIVAGTVSTVLALMIVISHYHFFPCCNPGGLEEIITVFLLLALWIAAVIVLTRVDGIASTVGNIYYSTWTALFTCIYILAKWRRANTARTERENAFEHNIDESQDSLDDI